jgi:membrane-associated phospholipid phosphatase
VALALCIAVTAILGGIYAHRSQAGWPDATVDARVEAILAGHSGLLNGISQLGSPIPMIVMTAAMSVACLVTRRWRGAVFAVIAVAAAAALGEFVLKPFFGRTLHGYYSFPSGHTTGVFAVAATLAVLLTGPLWPRLPTAVRWLCVLGAFLAGSATTTATTGMGAKHLPNAVGGVTVGVGAVLAAALAIDKLAAAAVQRRSVSEPMASAASSSLRRVWR